MTKGNVVQLGVIILLLGGISYGGLTLLGFEEAKAGIASQAVLIFLVIAWLFSYFFRVFTGKMTFMEQRKRYRKEYDQITQTVLQERLDSMSDDEKIALMKEVNENNENK
ncbi:DUF3007 family protein [Prochlorococcus marinus]|uniref:DUF3007 family protein n=1 Tax=Prochlorococcus marinus TaxID=1219 RepID=UPI0022B2F59F|nr:DUF3007 family protein [Prochlorococcus marinus]